MRKSILIFCQRNDFDLDYTRELVSLRNQYAGYDLLNRSRFTQSPQQALQWIKDAVEIQLDEVFLLTGMVYEVKDREYWDGGLVKQAETIVDESDTLLYTAVCASSPILSDERKFFNLVFEKRKVSAPSMVDHILQLMHPQWTQRSKNAFLSAYP